MALLQNKSVFITGGAGFIGRRIVARLRDAGARTITVYDSLHPQIHGPDASFPDLGDGVVCRQGAVEDAEALNAALQASAPDMIVHLASETGTGQSLDEIQRYSNVNVMGTVNLLNAISNLPEKPREFLLSSSRSVYGEGPHISTDGTPRLAQTRTPARMDTGDFEVYSKGGEPLKAVGMTSDAPVDPKSVYASSKLMQEHLVLNVAHAKNLSPRILRFQNVYGAGQSLRNPYTGVLSIFAAQILAGQRLNIFEDGEILRDFIYVDDVVSACIMALEHDAPILTPLDIGAGAGRTISKTAELLLTALGAPKDKYDVSGDYRDGDIRAAYADISAARDTLGWRPEITLEDGINRLANWAQDTF